jgi:hypothetical protein
MVFVELMTTLTVCDDGQLAARMFSPSGLAAHFGFDVALLPTFASLLANDTIMLDIVERLPAPASLFVPFSPPAESKSFKSFKEAKKAASSATHPYLYKLHSSGGPINVRNRFDCIQSVAQFIRILVDFAGLLRKEPKAKQALEPYRQLKLVNFVFGGSKESLVFFQLSRQRFDNLKLDVVDDNSILLHTDPGRSLSIPPMLRRLSSFRLRKGVSVVGVKLRVLRGQKLPF